MASFSNVDSSIGRPKDLMVGQLISVAVTDGGTGYVDGAAVAVTIGAPDDPAGEQAVATAVVASGVVTSITVTNPGSGYTSAPSISMATGSGLVAVANVAAFTIPLAEIVYVDETEAGTASNKLKGITHSGWYRVRSKQDQNGNTRYHTELLVVSANTAVGAGDAADDLVIPDVNTTVSITVQPTDQTAVAGGATFSITASIVPSGTAVYQWQVQTALQTKKWTNVDGATAASLALTGLTNDPDDGKKYRCVVSGGGSVETYSDVATLTVA